MLRTDLPTIRIMLPHLSRLLRHPFALLLLLLLSGILGIWYFATQAATDIDNEAQQLQGQTLEQELQRQRLLLASSLADYAMWNDMVAHVNRSEPDYDWLNDNITESVYHNLNVHYALLVAREHGVLLARRNGVLVTQPRQLLPISLQQWQQLLRGADRYARPGHYDNPPTQLLQLNIVNPQSGQAEPQLVLLALQRIVPEEEQLPHGAVPRYLAFMRVLDRQQLQQLRNSYGLQQLYLQFGAAPPPLTQRLPLKDNSGKILAYLAWQKSGPGQQLLQRILPHSLLLLTILLLLGGLLAHIAERWQLRSQRQSDRLRRQGETLQHLVTRRREDQQELNDYLEEVLPLLANTLQVARVSVWRFSADSRELNCIAGIHTLTGQQLGGELLAQQQHGDYFDAIRQQRYLASNIAQDDPRMQSLRPYLVEYGVRSLLDATILVGGMQLGVLCVEASQPRRWQQDEVNFVCSAADIIALVMESRARLYAEGELYRQFYYDRFTGLPNRTRLQMQLSELILQRQHVGSRDSAPLGCLMLAVEGLININELFGRDNGDLVIRELGRRLEAVIGNGEMVARNADNRFALLLLGSGEEQLARRVDALVGTLAKPLELHGQPLFIRLNVGLALYPHDTDDAESLLEHAEVALQMSREGPGGWVRYHPEINSTWRRRTRLQTDLRQAAARNELLLNFQPYVSLKSGQVAGAEALVRWQHPELGIIPPGDFIAMAEEIGVIHGLGEWVLTESVRHTAQWRRQYLANFTISVNVSLLQLEDEHFAEMVAALLATHHLPGKALELEVTEGLALRNTQTIDHNLQRLRALGIAIAIDDFGTGYASFSYLRRFPAEKLKIDKQFLDHVPDNDSSSNLVRMIVAMGHTLGASVTGEGIEHLAQARFLAAHGCDYAQGYLISRPLPAAALERFLVESEPLLLQADGSKSALLDINNGG